MYKNVTSKIWGAHSGVAEDSNPMGYYTMPTGEDVPTFRRVLLVPSSSGS